MNFIKKFFDNEIGVIILGFSIVLVIIKAMDILFNYLFLNT